MRKLRVGVIDLVTKGPSSSMYGRVMNANLVSIMPQVIATWCEQDGHDVEFFVYTGHEDILRELPTGCDIVFIGAFTQAAQFAYALSHLLRSRGAVTVLGGPHARCYPQDAVKYFDYVLGFTDRTVLDTVMEDCQPHRPVGRRIVASQQPLELPGVRERWKYIKATLEKAPLIKIVPMLASLGCPYTCSFCIDSVVPYQPLDTDVMKDDLRFLLKQYKRPRIGWHDPNFGVRFNDVMEAIEDAAPEGSVDFIAESSLSLLNEDHLKRLRRNGFKAILPGIESWYDMGNKSKTGKRQGLEKVEAVSDHINLIFKYIPYIQTNFVLGLDGDSGPEPFDLTARFLDRAPGAFPAYSLLTAFGQAAPLNLDYQRAGRVLPFPFHFLNNNHAMNVKPANYTWPEFYDHVVAVSRYSFSWRSIGRRFKATQERIPRWMNMLRAMSSEGFGRIRYHTEVRRRLDEDRDLRDYFEGETTVLPEFYVNRIKRDLGPLWDWLPEGALEHDPNAYLAEAGDNKPKVQMGTRATSPMN